MTGDRVVGASANPAPAVLAATGRGRASTPAPGHPEPPPCVCGDLWAGHRIGRLKGARVRKNCSRSGCGCVVYTPVGAS